MTVCQLPRLASNEASRSPSVTFIAFKALQSLNCALKVHKKCKNGFYVKVSSGLPVDSVFQKRVLQRLYQQASGRDPVAARLVCPETIQMLTVTNSCWLYNQHLFATITTLSAFPMPTCQVSLRLGFVQESLDIAFSLWRTLKSSEEAWRLGMTGDKLERVSHSFFFSK